MANEIEKLKVELLDPELVALADKIVQVIEDGKQALAVSINEIIKTTYWRIGQYIVEFEQQGNAKAKIWHIAVVESCEAVEGQSRAWI